MDRPFYSPLTPSGLIRSTTRLPERLVGELDIAVAHERMEGNWLSRSEAINQVLRRFLSQQTLSTLSDSTIDAAISGRRRSVSMHLDYDLLVQMRIAISDTRATGLHWAEWEVLAVAIRWFLDSGGFSN